jgi:hypothetical protein
MKSQKVTSKCKHDWDDTGTGIYVNARKHDWLKMSVQCKLCKANGWEWYKYTKTTMMESHD